jgi:acetylornithine deacetylase/succinyl-diaminopimelate desuccinylase-like protein
MLLAASIAGACRKAAPPQGSVVEEAQLRSPEQWLEDEGVRLLRDYVRIETTETAGELGGAEFWKRFFDCAGIENEIVCPAPRRCNVLARIPGRKREGAMLLLNHIDVVPAFGKYWKESAPFEGTIKGGYLYGRGAFDMKSLAIAQALAMRTVKRLGIVPESDVLFLAEADEEFGQKWGARWLLAHRPEWFRGVRWVFNEGGTNEMILREIRFFGIETLQSGTAWAELEASAEAPLSELSARWKQVGKPISKIHPHVREGFDLLANHLVHPLTEPLRDLDRTLADPVARQALPDRYGAFLEPRVFWTAPFPHPIDSDAPVSRRIILVISTPPGIDPTPFLEAILSDAKKSRIALVRSFSSEPTEASPWREGGRLVAPLLAIERTVEAVYPGIPFGLVPTHGVYTSSVLFRRHGIAAYGFSPFPMNLFDAARRHVNDERVFLLDYVAGVRLYEEFLLEYLAAEQEVSVSAPHP